jgi:HAD superfamily phosphoserine phosphatase-like hydrolase
LFFKLKEIFFTYYLAKYYSIEELENIGKSYAKKRLPKIIYKGALKQIKWHKENNHKVIILTASSTIWLSAWCKLNELEIIGTEFAKKDGKFTGKIWGKNCHGKQKLLILNNILSETGVSLTYGYGDSKADKLFLEKVKYSNYKPSWT